MRLGPPGSIVLPTASTFAFDFSLRSLTSGGLGVTRSNPKKSRTPTRQTDFARTTNRQSALNRRRLKAVSFQGSAVVGTLTRQSPGHFPDFGKPLKLCTCRSMALSVL